jgi:hypothetical protein
MQTSPPVSAGSELMALLIEVNLPKVFTPSPTVTVQQHPHSPWLIEGGHPVRQSVAEAGKVTMDSRA